MDYFAAFEVSASGMTVQKLRLDVIAANLANVNTTRSAEGGVYRPLEVLIGERTGFESHLQAGLRGLAGLGAEVVDVRPLDLPPRLVHDPGHPDADEQGFVEFPAISPVSEMVSLIEATRAYEANVRAMEAAREMALRALEIGGSR
jgi:flagellar basal-body rod protein FlgC